MDGYTLISYEEAKELKLLLSHKSIDGYESYTICEDGTVKNRYGKIIKHEKRKNGYTCVLLYNNGIPKHKSIHRLVAQAFIPNPENKPQVNHINSIRDDNRIENLEWCTASENILHGCKYGNIKPSMYGLGRFGKLNSNSKYIYQYTLDGEFIRRRDCGVDIQKELGFNNRNISACCLGSREKAHGYVRRHNPINEEDVLLGEHYQYTINKLSIDSEKKHNWETCDCETCGDFRGFKREHHQYVINTSSIDSEKETTEQQSDVVEKIMKDRIDTHGEKRAIYWREMEKILRKHLSSK